MNIKMVYISLEETNLKTFDTLMLLRMHGTPTQRTPMNANRKKPGAVVQKGVLYVVGGNDGFLTSKKYDADTKMWTIVIIIFSPSSI